MLFIVLLQVDVSVRLHSRHLYSLRSRNGEEPLQKVAFVASVLLQHCSTPELSHLSLHVWPTCTQAFASVSNAGAYINRSLAAIII